MNKLNKFIFSDEFGKWAKWLRLIYLVGIPTYVGFSVYYNGLPSLAEAQSTKSIILGLILAVLVSALMFFVDLGFTAWDKSTTWLTKFLRRYPVLRRVAVLPVAVATPILGVNISFFHWSLDNVLRVIFFIYTVLIFPAAILSTIKDERAREHVRLAKEITPELIINNPQAAIEYAFTVFEDHLRKRVGANRDVYGEKLINYAFAKNGKLIFSDLESENEGARNFISGAYAIFRNQRKHGIVQDDEKTVLTIIDTVELLIKIVDESKSRE